MRPNLHAEAPWSLNTQNPAPNCDFGTEEYQEFKKRFSIGFGHGWKAGFYDKIDRETGLVSSECPFENADDQRYFEAGIMAGMEARKTINADNKTAA